MAALARTRRARLKSWLTPLRERAAKAKAGPPLERAVHKMRQPLGMLLAGAQCIGLERQHGAKGGSELVSEEERNALRAQRLVEAA